MSSGFEAGDFVECVRPFGPLVLGAIYRVEWHGPSRIWPHHFGAAVELSDLPGERFAPNRFRRIYTPKAEMLQTLVGDVDAERVCG
jgi:hypothetical protein